MVLTKLAEAGLCISAVSPLLFPLKVEPLVCYSQFLTECAQGVCGLRSFFISKLCKDSAKANYNRPFSRPRSLSNCFSMPSFKPIALALLWLDGFVVYSVLLRHADFKAKAASASLTSRVHTLLQANNFKNGHGNVLRLWFMTKRHRNELGETVGRTRVQKRGWRR